MNEADVILSSTKDDKRSLPNKIKKEHNVQNRQMNSTTEDVKSSVTALSVAMGFTRALATEYEYLFSRPQLALATHLWQTGRQSLGWFNWAFSGVVSLAPYSAQQSFFNSIVIPAYDQTIMLRKLMIMHKVNEAISSGATQIVFLAGGYDIRALMTARNHPTVNVFEVDRGPTRDAKVKGLCCIPAGIGFDDVKPTTDDRGTLVIGNNLKLIECDLAKDNLLNALIHYGYDPAKKTIVIAEGLTMYLSKAENRRLLDMISQLISDNSSLLLSYMAAGRKLTSLEENALKETNETYQSPLPPEEVISFVRPSGYMVCQHFHAADKLKDLGDPALTVPRDNTRGINEHYYLLQKSDHIPEMNMSDVPMIDFSIPPKVQPVARMCTYV